MRTALQSRRPDAEVMTKLKRDLRRAAVYTERARQRISAIHHLMWHSIGSVGSTMIAGLFLGTSAGLNDGRVLR